MIKDRRLEGVVLDFRYSAGSVVHMLVNGHIPVYKSNRSNETTVNFQLISSLACAYLLETKKHKVTVDLETEEFQNPHSRCTLEFTCAALTKRGMAIGVTLNISKGSIETGTFLFTEGIAFIDAPDSVGAHKRKGLGMYYEEPLFIQISATQRKYVLADVPLEKLRQEFDSFSDIDIVDLSVWAELFSAHTAASFIFSRTKGKLTAATIGLHTPYIESRIIDYSLYTLVDAIEKNNFGVFYTELQVNQIIKTLKKGNMQAVLSLVLDVLVVRSSQSKCLLVNGKWCTLVQLRENLEHLKEEFLVAFLFAFFLVDNQIYKTNNTLFDVKKLI